MNDQQQVSPTVEEFLRLYRPLFGGEAETVQGAESITVPGLSHEEVQRLVDKTVSDNALKSCKELWDEHLVAYDISHGDASSTQTVYSWGRHTPGDFSYTVIGLTVFGLYMKRKELEDSQLTQATTNSAEPELSGSSAAGK